MGRGQFLKGAIEIRRALTTFAATAVATGCGCMTTDAGRTLDEQLVMRNRANAEPAMRDAARQVDAALLPAETQAFEMSPLCGLSGDPCLEEVEFRGPFSRVRDTQGNAHLAIWVPAELRRYARLAKGRHRLVLLTPRLSERVIGERTSCECDGMYRAPARTQVAFLVDDTPGLEIVTLSVPMNVDRYEWRCEAILR